ncbi:prophage endopeptidase [Izhakiella capsodis]|uniref:Prophage endopeptidase n=1 Tax=Izhakiella capsodis TaxID=1367852 RepID=A0A1I4X4E4_9GAMM|nr:lysis protein [Izhakiella capsodis]SFN20089.1 prophage endopeptidase [Izhakiella capsodis]
MIIPLRPGQIVTGLTVSVIIVLAILASHYRSNYYKAIKKQREFVQLAEARLNTINNMQRQQREVAALDAKYMKELNNARHENDRLRDDVATGRHRLRIKGTCCVPETSASSGMGNGGTVELSRETGSTLFDIRAEIINDQHKLRFLQDYIRYQCQ